MKINTNLWNRIRYTFYAPIYDMFVRAFDKSRERSIDTLDIKPGNTILIIGAGTGLDLEFLPDTCEITATDITPSMIDRIKKRNRKLNRNLKAIVMDGQSLEFVDNSFDIVILHLILAVIPDPVACIKEAERVLKPDGQVVVYDKFVQKNSKVSLLRRFFNLFTSFLMTDITRDFESILNSSHLDVLSDIDADFNGNFRLIKMTK